MRLIATTGVVLALGFAFAGTATAANEAVISDVRVIPKVSTKDYHYLSVKFVFTVEERITSKKSLQINAKCKAGSRTLRVDSFTGLSVQSLPTGTTKDGSATLFMSDRVLHEIEQCSMRFELHTYGHKYTDKPIGRFCWTGSDVKEGTCEED